MNPDDLLARVAKRQHGLALRSQARECGLTKRALSYRIERGTIRPVSNRVLAIAGAPDTQLQRALAAVLEAGFGGCLALESAAAFYGCPGYRLEPTHVWRVRDRSRSDNSLGIQHKTRRLPPHHFHKQRGIWVTTPARTVADLAARLPPARLSRLVDDAWGRGLVSYAALVTITDEMQRRGRKGIPLLRELTEARGPDHRPPASNLERRVATLLLDRGLGTFDRQVDVSGPQGWIGRVDFKHRTAPLVLEVQSDLFHDGLTNRADDAQRIRRLEDAGMVVVELWEFEVWHRPDEVRTLVAEGLNAARRLHARPA